MTRRRLLLLASVLLLVLAACGGGVEENGGGADVTVSDTKPDTTDTTGATDTTTADDENGDLPPGQDPRNILGDDQALNDLANQCFDGDMQACDDLFAQTPVDSDLEAYSQTCGGRIDEVDGSPDCVARFASASDPQEPGDFNDAEFDRLAGECFDGDLASCDELFRVTPVGSAAEAYGSTCGGRLEEGVSGDCEDLLGGDAESSGATPTTAAG
jgi:hypothetical protein